MQKRITLVLTVFFPIVFAMAKQHPTLVITKATVTQIQASLGTIPLFDETLTAVKAEVDAAIVEGVEVPVPKDPAGGYTHSQHKKNFLILKKAGLVFQITKDERYAVFVKEMLFKYREIYPSLDRHPYERSYARGKLFWQCLNDANWLVYVSQAYDCIYDWLPAKERKDLNKHLFRPMADFLSLENPRFFNRIHNHSTWATAAVGMIGMVMEDEELVQRALYGLKKAPNFAGQVDNDGGSVEMKGDAGFIAQIDHAFSPDGYYTEGPYYQRYAMYPFLIFSEAIYNNKPELKIFDYREGVMIKAVYALLNQTNGVGEFFPLNDSQKGMSYFSRELTTAISLAYAHGAQDPTLLSLVEMQGIVPLDGNGYESALAISKGKSKPFEKSSVELTDGADGKGGALGILRSVENGNEISLVMKYAKHGMGHGHFDRLSYSLYNHADEVIQDYGAARWVNIEQKDGGGYLKENKTWAKQTIAHNTVVVDQKSQFKGKTKSADAIDPQAFFFDASNKDVQVVSAKDTNAYPGVALHRTMVMIKDAQFDNPVILDLFRVNAKESHHLELPFYFKGHVMQTNFTYEQAETLSPMAPASLGKKAHGYQHLYTEAIGQSDNQVSQMNWFLNNKFYTLTSEVSNDDQLVFGRIGAADPKFNLRRDPVFIIRKEKAPAETIFANVLEIHGSYSTVTELSKDIYGQVEKVETLLNTTEYTVAHFTCKSGDTWTFAMSNLAVDPLKSHQVKVKGKKVEWQGNYILLKNNQLFK